MQDCDADCSYKLGILQNDCYLYHTSLFCTYQHLGGSALNSDWDINDFIMVMSMTILFKIHSEFSVQSTTKNFLRQTFPEG